MEGDRRFAGGGDGDDRHRLDADSIKAAARALAAGKLVILPTETVYGLAADAGDAAAIATLYAAKGRPAFNPLIAHIPGWVAATEIACLDDRARRLAEAFWPGPLTMVARYVGGETVCDRARAGLVTIAVRAPAHPIAQAVLLAFGRPIVAPSANRSSRPSPTTFGAALAETGGAAAVALDGGSCRMGLESTVIALLDGAARLLRPGSVTRGEIESVIGPLADADTDAHRSPGRLARHYAPNSPLRLEATDIRSGEAHLAFGGTPRGPGVVDLSPSGDLAEAAANLFTLLTAADARSPTAIAVAPIPVEGIGEAINDRLRRAAGFVG